MWNELGTKELKEKVHGGKGMVANSQGKNLSSCEAETHMSCFSHK